MRNITHRLGNHELKTQLVGEIAYGVSVLVQVSGCVALHTHQITSKEAKYIRIRNIRRMRSEAQAKRDARTSFRSKKIRLTSDQSVFYLTSNA
jgi:hypothetical protein